MLGGYFIRLHLLVGKKEQLEQSTECNVYKRPVEHEFGSTMSMSMTLTYIGSVGLSLKTVISLKQFAS